ncbi:MAG: hypothetical protein FWH12_01880 [Treponema sp.]|nr:hypothetical protein [Treponema sp.]
MITLKSKRLEIGINEAGEGNNRKFRFDRSAFISSIVLDGKHQFCAREPEQQRQPSTGGEGLCSEIQCNEIVSGFALGERYPKFGVGLILKQDEEGYIFHREYDCQFFDLEIEAKESEAVLLTRPRTSRGYALEGKKTLSLEDNKLSIVHHYINRGDKALDLTEYNHNFVSLAGEMAGPQMEINFPLAASLEGKGPRREGQILCGTERGFGFSGQSSRASMIDAEAEEIDPSRPFSWTLKSSASGLWISEGVSFRPDRMTIWTIGDIVSPEVFHRFSLASGEEITYSREWTFGS